MHSDPARGRAATRLEDLHGYDVLTAVEFARTRVIEAYAQGCREIEFGHGAGDVGAPVDGGRGRIKWELRRLLESGSLDRWVDRDRSWPRTTSLLLALRANPSPRAAGWSPAPPRTYP